MHICNFVLQWTIFAVEMPSTVTSPHSKFQLNHTRRYQDMNFQNLAQFLCFFFFFFFSSWYECYLKVEIGYLNALKFGTQKGCVMAHLGTKFGQNTINTCKVIRNYSRKITPICCHAHRVNREWQEAENWYRGRLSSEPQTFCGLKGIELKTMKIQQKNQQCVIITRSRITNKVPLHPDKPLCRINRKLVCGWINQL